MGRKQGPRKGSMQVWPRKRAEKFLPRVNWKPVIELKEKKPDKEKTVNLLGFIGYKAGMASAYVKDNTPDSMTKNKRIIVPVTIIECPSMKILSIRFYKNKKILREILNEVLDKELVRIIKMPKKKTDVKNLLESVKIEDFDDVQLMMYSEVKKTGLKKIPDISEIALNGSKEEKIKFIKENLNREFSVADVFPKGLVDVRGITIGHGFQGAVKRFGIRLRFHKSEKGVRRVGSIGAWHPTGVRFRVPMPGQMGFHSRICLNNSIVASKKFEGDKDMISKRVFQNYGIIKNDYIVIQGSVQGSQKRQLLITSPFRATKKQSKKNYEFLELR
jgi:large subunit ribosomal protein L3